MTLLNVDDEVLDTIEEVMDETTDEEDDEDCTVPFREYRVSRLPAPQTSDEFPGHSM